MLKFSFEIETGENAQVKKYPWPEQLLEKYCHSREPWHCSVPTPPCREMGGGASLPHLWSAGSGLAGVGQLGLLIPNPATLSSPCRFSRLQGKTQDWSLAVWPLAGNGEGSQQW